MAVHKRELVLRRPEQLKAIAHPIRTRILNALEVEPGSAKRVAVRLGLTHGNVGYHLKVLEAAGIVEVVAEKKVRAVTERIFGPSYDVIRVELSEGDGDRLRFLFEQAAREAAPATQQPFDEYTRLYAVQMPAARATEFARRLVDLADEFAASEAPGPLFGFAGAVYRVDAGS